ncbi:MAG: amidohydrolase [Euryarchaeota archaeon]|nr:amidohydrolase [Euryarchaeota archaeon]
MILKNCSWIVTQNQKREILRNKDVLIDDEIIEIGPNLKGEEAIDCSGKALLPGLINAHTHLAMTLLRGYADDMLLQDWLQNKIWPLEAKLNEDYVYCGALLGAVELIKSGATCFNDMYFFGNGVKRAAEEVGIRAIFSQGVLDFPTAEFKNSKEAFKIFKKLIKQKSELFQPAIGTHSPYTCSEETLLKAKEIAGEHNALLHIHASETRKEVYDFLKQKGKRPIEYLNSINFLGEEVLIAHAGWATKGEVAILGKTKTSVAHCPTSNMKLAVGAVAPLPEMFENNVNVVLGSDSAASNNSLDLFREMRLASLLQKAHRWDATLLPAQKALDMATIDAARALHMQDKIGSIEVGKKADLILLDFKKPHLTPAHNIVSNLVYSASGSDVDTAIVNGEILMQNRRITTLNEREVLEKAEKAARELVGP